MMSADRACPSIPPGALRLRLDREALAGNWRALDRLSGDARAGAAVKANAYGVGTVRAAETLAAAGCADFFVAHCGEAAELLGIVPAGAISVLHGPLTPQEARFCIEAGVKPVLNSPAQIARWREAGGGTCDLMVDTGINRLGLPMDALADAGLQDLAIDVLMSHLASADDDAAQNAEQLGRFEEARRAIPHRRASLANSAGIVLGTDYHAHLTRPGLAIYGGVPRPELAPVITQVLYPQAAVLQLRALIAGEAVGYNATFVAPRAMRIAVLAIGYADGFLRCWSAGRGTMLCHGRRVPVLGRVSMDMAVVDVSACPECCEGDWLTVEYALPAAAKASGLSQYELLTLMSRRFERP